VSVQIEAILENFVRWISVPRKGEAGESYISRDFTICIAS
jgi:hypothetical protein